MDQSTTKSSAKPSETVKKPEPVKFQVPTTGFAKELSKYPSTMDSILQFIAHPFLLLGGIAVAIYFFYKERQSRNMDSAIDGLDLNKELRAEIKALKKENKTLKAQLGSLQDDDEYDLAPQRKSVSPSRKRIGVARLE